MHLHIRFKSNCKEWPMKIKWLIPTLIRVTAGSSSPVCACISPPELLSCIFTHRGRMKREIWANYGPVQQMYFHTAEWKRCKNKTEKIYIYLCVLIQTVQSRLRWFTTGEKWRWMCTVGDLWNSCSLLSQQLRGGLSSAAFWHGQVTHGKRLSWE